VNFCACVQRHLFTWDDHTSFKGKGLGVRKVSIQIDRKQTATFNVLVIVCESLRKRSLGVYGNPKNTTPKLQEFIASRPASTYLFEKPFTVSTTTMLAVPATLSGIGPYQDSSLLYSQPLIWDYAKQYDYKRFFLENMFNQNYYNIINQNYIVFLQKMLEAYEVNYLMLDAFDMMVQDLNRKDDITHLINKKTYWGFGKQTIRDFLIKVSDESAWEYPNPFEEIPSKHPNENGYNLISEEIYNYIVKNNII
jgi:hypothetical protein